MLLNHVLQRVQLILETLEHFGDISEFIDETRFSLKSYGYVGILPMYRSGDGEYGNRTRETFPIFEGAGTSGRLTADWFCQLTQLPVADFLPLGRLQGVASLFIAVEFSLSPHTFQFMEHGDAATNPD